MASSTGGPSVAELLAALRAARACAPSEEASRGAVDCFCAAANAVIAPGSPSEGGTSSLDSGGATELLESLLGIDEAVQRDTEAKLRLWRALIGLLKRVHLLVSAPLASRLLAVLDGYTRGGVQSLQGLAADSQRHTPAVDSIVDMLMFFVQRLGATLLYLSTGIGIKQASRALWTLAACRGAVDEPAGRAVAQVLLRVLFSKTHPAGSERLRRVFCGCAETQLRDGAPVGLSGGLSPLEAGALLGSVRLWAAVLSEPGQDGGSLRAAGLSACLRCLSALTVLHTGFAADHELAELCGRVGGLCGRAVTRGDLTLAAHLISMSCLRGPDGVWARAVLRGAAPSAGGTLGRLALDAVRRASGCPTNKTATLNGMGPVMRVLLRYAPPDGKVMLLRGLLKACRTIHGSCVPVQAASFRLLLDDPTTAPLARELQDMCSRGSGQRRREGSATNGTVTVALATGRLSAASYVLTVPLQDRKQNEWTEVVAPILFQYISALEMHYHAVLSAPSPSAPLLARLLEKRCRFLTGLSGLQSIPLSCSRGAQELALGARLMADAVAVLQAPPVEDMSPVNLVCAVCVEGCRVASASLVTAGDGLSQESSVQALAPPCKTLCRAMATLQSLAGRRAAYSSIIRLTAGRSWALLLRALVTLVAGLPPLLRDNVAYTCLLEEVLPRVAAWSRRAVPLPAEATLATVGCCILDEGR